MKIKFKQQAFQSEAVSAVVDCFAGQPFDSGITYRIDPGKLTHPTPSAQLVIDEVHRAQSEQAGVKNNDLAIPLSAILKNIQTIQQHQNLPVSPTLKTTPITNINLDIEMETGTGKTYCYIKTMFELNKRYGWSKFIVVVPSIAIREGVFQSFSNTAEHFLEQYGKKTRAFIYNSKQLHNLESFSSDSGINVMVINVQAFNARGQDARRIYEELDDFQSRRPIDVISRNRPILILDEPQKMEGARTVDALKEFSPLMILRYSATHKVEHNKIYRLDALDAFNQKLVKKIAVRGISVKGLAGTNAYLYLEEIRISKEKAPEARLELEISRAGGIKRETRVVGKNTNLYSLSGELEQYRGFVVADIDANENSVAFTNGLQIHTGQATGDVNEAALRRIQIREAVNAHFEKEQLLFSQNIKVLSLFFIDEVAKYRSYNEAGEQSGEYARIFEEEYNQRLSEILTLDNFGDVEYTRYLKRIETSRTHEGYFSIDKKTKRLINPDKAARTGETDDVDAYDLILKKKERLLSFEEPVRFIFSHSALREGWDNPNVFVICALKHSDNTISRRQEVGRGLRLCVNQHGDRVDHPAIVHEVNVLTVVASESYKDFVTAIQKDIGASLSARPRKASTAYFEGKTFTTDTGEGIITPIQAKLINRYLAKNDYIDLDDQIAAGYHEAKTFGTLASLPPDLATYSDAIFKLIDGVYDESQTPLPEDGRKPVSNPRNANFEKKEFQALWSQINRKAAYNVDFDTAELQNKCIAALNRELKVSPLQYTIQRGEQTETTTYEKIRQGEAFKLQETQTQSMKASVHSAVRYDLIGKIAEDTKLTRATIGAILTKIRPSVFSQYQVNPEDFMRKAAILIDEQKATVIVEHLSYSPVEETWNSDIFTQAKPKDTFNRAVKSNRHIYDYVFTDSEIEKKFVRELDTGTDVVVYAKLPGGFSIPTPVGDYNPDWAIAFQEGTVKHIYFVAETKGSLSSLQLREIEKCKINCARKFFHKITSDQVKYEVVDSYAKLMDLVK
jgi:type III restriction enzyme